MPVSSKSTNVVTAVRSVFVGYRGETVKLKIGRIYSKRRRLFTVRPQDHKMSVNALRLGVSRLVFPPFHNTGNVTCFLKAHSIFLRNALGTKQCLSDEQLRGQGPYYRHIRGFPGLKSYLIYVFLNGRQDLDLLSQEASVIPEILLHCFCEVL